MGMIINPYRFGGGATWTPPNAVLWYYGSFLSGSQWADRIGSNHGTFQGGASAAADGVACSGTKYVTAASDGINTLVAGNYTLSLSAWIKSTQSGLICTVIAKYRTGGITGDWSFGLRTSTSPDQIDIGISSGRKITNLTSYNGSGTWLHIAVTYNNGALKLYENGSPLGTNSITSVEIPSNVYDMVVGKDLTYIDDVIISSSVWTDANVLDIYNNSPATHKP